jgi:hypothetical protein
MQLIWGDFVFDSVLGPVLALPSDSDPDLAAGVRKSSDTAQNQETRQRQQPARMVGSAMNSLDSAEAGRMLAAASLMGGER